MRFTLWLLIYLCALSACQKSGDSLPNTGKLFEDIPAAYSGIEFRNDLAFDKKFNIYTYRNFYNGGGVALGDINNDGLIDIYFTSNQKQNKLYLNRGNLKFEDITDQAGVGGKAAWSTGVSMADVNGDGWLDIYVCNSGDIAGDNKQNELFINNQNLTFTEQAEKYHVADRGFTTHAAFFDYDKDGDLDLYILNNSYQAIGSFNLRKSERPKRDPLGGDKLMRNDGDRFVDVSDEAGIYGSVIGFGLGVTVGDINKDGWPDIYVSNDFFERDYLYLNNQRGGFAEVLPQQMKSISGASMGADLADINNDQWPDLFITEMLPEDYGRLKTVTTFENWDRYQYNVENDYYHQFTRNILQLNNGDSTFSEIGRLANVAATDWSWGALIFDMDNDGWKDIFVANGIYQDLTDQDYLQYISSEEIIRSVISKNQVDYKKLVDVIPSNPVPNYALQNNRQLQFTNQAAAWGLGGPGFSNGSAYGDLDNDGDLDLVVNNVNATASVFQNQTNKLLPEHHFIKLVLKGKKGNQFALGTKVTVELDSATLYYEQMPIRGFESSVDPRPNIGLGESKLIRKLSVEWPSNAKTVLENVRVDQILELLEPEATSEKPTTIQKARRTFAEATTFSAFTHRENTFVDFDRDRLVYHMISNEGPRACTGDVNGDGLTDVYIGGASGQSGSLLVQQKNGQFLPVATELFAADSTAEDGGCTFFDADRDGDLDLYVTSGGNEFSSSSTALIDRLYLNGGGRWRKSEQLLPTTKFESTSVVSATDMDQDGDQDLFVGVRLQPLYYGVPVSSYVLQNDGKGQFTDVTASWAPGLQQIGMITDGQWVDLDGDRDWDLVVAGEWTAIRVFINQDGRLQDKTEAWGLSATKGWWNRLAIKDLDGDGDPDIVAGNHGWNSRFQASPKQPVTMWVNDFDGNGTIEHIVARYWGDTQYPMALRHDLVQQLPYLKKKYLKYENYKDQTVTDIFGPEALQRSVRLDAEELGSIVLWNEGGRFRKELLPVEAQVSPVYGILAEDIDGDGQVDLLLGGNQYRAKPEVGRYDSSYGVYLRGLGNQQFAVVPNRDSGLLLDGEIRDLKVIKINGKRTLLVLRNNDSALSVPLP